MALFVFLNNRPLANLARDLPLIAPAQIISFNPIGVSVENRKIGPCEHKCCSLPKEFDTKNGRATL